MTDNGLDRVVEEFLDALAERGARAATAVGQGAGLPAADGRAHLGGARGAAVRVRRRPPRVLRAAGRLTL